MDIVQRLRQTRLSAPDINGGRRQVLLNPDGEDAAQEIERLRAAAAGEQGGEGWMRVPQGFVIAVNEFLADWQKGDFSLSTLAALDVQSIIEAKERWADALAAG